MTQIQELVEAALAASTADGCVVIAAGAHRDQPALGGQQPDHERADAHARGHGRLDLRRRRRHARRRRHPLGHERRRARRPRARRRAGRARRRPGRRRRAAGRRTTSTTTTGPATRPRPSVAVFEQFAPALGAAFDRWRKADRLLFGFAEHHMTSTYLGTSTGLRRRFDQPDGRVEINGKSADYARSAYADQHTNDFADVDVDALDRRARPAPGLGARSASTCPPAATRRSCRRPPSPT